MSRWGAKASHATGGESEAADSVEVEKGGANSCDQPGSKKLVFDFGDEGTRRGSESASPLTQNTQHVRLAELRSRCWTLRVFG